jgi:hypothetical protein
MSVSLQLSIWTVDWIYHLHSLSRVASLLLSSLLSSSTCNKYTSRLMRKSKSPRRNLDIRFTLVSSPSKMVVSVNCDLRHWLGSANFLHPVCHVPGRNGRFASRRESEHQIWRSHRLLVAADDDWWVNATHRLRTTNTRGLQVVVPAWLAICYVIIVSTTGEGSAYASTQQNCSVHTPGLFVIVTSMAAP